MPLRSAPLFSAAVAALAIFSTAPGAAAENLLLMARGDRMLIVRVARSGWRFAALAVMLVCVAAGPARTLHAAETERPNFVFFFVDDLGWTDVGCFGSDLYETPNIDRLAERGMKFTQAYSACTVCSPSRAALLTGQYPARLRVTDFIPGHPIENTPLRIPDWIQRLEHRHTTLAEALSDAGYATAHVGKWHLAPRERDKPDARYPEYWPERHGFDVNIGGFKAGAPGSYHWPYGRGRDGQVRRVINLPPGGQEGEYLTDRLTDEAIQTLDRFGSRPFFLYFSYYTVHAPIQGRPDLVEHYEEKVQPGMEHNNAHYAAMVGALDQSVGRVMAKLDQMGVADRTIVVFTSDNGGLTRLGSGRRVTSNTPLRQGKGSVYEGGVRVPAIVRWPGAIGGGAVCDEPIIGMDFYPTVLEIAGVDGDAEHNRRVDGVSLVPLLREPNAQLDRDAIYWHYPHYHMGGAVPYSAVRQRQWKLIDFLGDRPVELYRLSEDVHEDHNVADQYPEKTRQLRDRLHRWRQRIGAQMPTPNPQYDPQMPTGWKRGDSWRLPEPVREE